MNYNIKSQAGVNYVDIYKQDKYRPTYDHLYYNRQSQVVKKEQPSMISEAFYQPKQPDVDREY